MWNKSVLESYLWIEWLQSWQQSEQFNQTKCRNQQANRTKYFSVSYKRGGEFWKITQHKNNIRISKHEIYNFVHYMYACLWFLQMGLVTCKYIVLLDEASNKTYLSAVVAADPIGSGTLNVLSKVKVSRCLKTWTRRRRNYFNKSLSLCGCFLRCLWYSGLHQKCTQEWNCINKPYSGQNPSP